MADITAPLSAGFGMLQSPDLNWAAGQVVTVGVASTQSAVITARAVFVSADTDCWITVGANPTAAVGAAGSLHVATGAMLTLPLFPGQRIAAIQTTAAGHLSIIPCVYPA